MASTPTRKRRTNSASAQPAEPTGRIAEAVLAEYDAGRTTPLAEVAARLGVDLNAPLDDEQ